MEFKHYSVLRDETIENLNIRPDLGYMWMVLSEEPGTHMR